MFGILAIAIAIPLTIRSTNQQTETQSRAAELTSTTQTQTNALGTVTVNSSTNLSQLAAAPAASGDRKYVLNVAYGKGNSCYQSTYEYKVNGLKFSRTGKAPEANLCMALFTSISSSSNCNTFSLIAPSGYHNVGIGYKRLDVGLGNFRYESVSSKTLCDYNYSVLFAIEPN